MTTHKFKAGQSVFLAPSYVSNLPGGAYVVTKQMPKRDGEFEYHVRSVNEPHERVARESELQTTA